MMATIELTGWTVGLDKIAAVAYFHGFGPFGLRESKDIVDRLLAGESVNISIPSIHMAPLIIDELAQLCITANLKQE